MVESIPLPSLGQAAAAASSSNSSTTFGSVSAGFILKVETKIESVGGAGGGPMGNSVKDGPTLYTKNEQVSGLRPEDIHEHPNVSFISFANYLTFFIDLSSTQESNHFLVFV